MANARGKTIDTTHLSIDNAEERGFLHRDYIAHCFRWTYVVRWLLRQNRYKTSNIMDVGCGKEAPLAKLLYTSKMHPKAGYIGVDYGKIEPPEWLAKQDKFELSLIERCDFSEDPRIQAHFQKVDLITSFEVLEHVEPAHAVKMLLTMKNCLKSGGTAIISTPNFDPKVGPAGNHVNELSHLFLEHCIKMCGFKIVKKHGTFASQTHIKQDIEKDGHMPLFEKLRDYYDTNVLATFFAPLYPEQSRNCLWEITPADFPSPMVVMDMEGVIAGSSASAEAWSTFYSQFGAHFLNADKQVMYTEDKQSDDFMV